MTELDFVALDFESTGLAAWEADEVCEVGLVRVTGESIESVMSTFVDPGRPIPPVVQELTGISDGDVAGAPPFAEIYPGLLAAIGTSPLVIHNAPFDLAFLAREAQRSDVAMLSNLTIDTLLACRLLNGGRDKNSLNHACARLGIERSRSHRGVDDAIAAARVWRAIGPALEEWGIESVGDLVRERVAAPADVLVAAPSSVVLDMLTRAVRQQAVVEMRYSRPPRRQTRGYRIRPLELIADRELVAAVVAESEPPAQERRFRIIDIMTMVFEGRTFISPMHVASEPPQPVDDR